MRLLEAVIRTNEEQPRKVVGLLEKHWRESRRRASRRARLVVQARDERRARESRVSDHSRTG